MLFGKKLLLFVSVICNVWIRFLCVGKIRLVGLFSLVMLSVLLFMFVVLVCMFCLNRNVGWMCNCRWRLKVNFLSVILLNVKSVLFVRLWKCVSNIVVFRKMLVFCFRFLMLGLMLLVWYFGKFCKCWLMVFFVMMWKFCLFKVLLFLLVFLLKNVLV